jgi:hypothetical protein
MSLFRARFDRLMGVSGRTSKVAAILGLAVLALHWAVMAAFIVPRLGSLGYVRLHYTATLGVDWVGQWWKLFTFPIAGTVIAFVNALLSGMLIKSTPRGDIVIHCTTALLQIMLATAGIMALLLNS